MMVLKNFHNNGIQTVLKNSTMMELKRILNDDTKNVP